eukprot:5115217-Amphidinium_carterae.1
MAGFTIHALPGPSSDLWQDNSHSTHDNRTRQSYLCQVFLTMAFFCLADSLRCGYFSPALLPSPKSRLSIMFQLASTNQLNRKTYYLQFKKDAILKDKLLDGQPGLSARLLSHSLTVLRREPLCYNCTAGALYILALSARLSNY